MENMLNVGFNGPRDGRLVMPLLPHKRLDQVMVLDRGSRSAWCTKEPAMPVRFESR
jgi:hypothetical protein